MAVEPQTLITHYLLGDLTSTQAEQLNQWVKASPENAQLFAEELFTHRYLRDAFAGDDTQQELTGSGLSAIGQKFLQRNENSPKPAVSVSKLVKPRVKSRQLMQKAVPWIVSAAAAIIFVVMAWQASSRKAKELPGRVETPIAQTPAKPASHAVPTTKVRPAITRPMMGVLLEQVSAKWATGSPAVKPGDTLDTDTMRLSSGLVKLRMNEGAELIIEGPAEFTLETESDIHLAYGKAVATCRKGAEGFTVRSDKAKVTDLGTEFGVQAWGEKGLQAVVFDGTILVEPESEESVKQSTKPQLLKKGTAATVSEKGEVKYGDDAKQWFASQFVRQQEFTLCAKASKSNRPFDRWLAYSYKLRRDVSLVAYYNMQPSDSDRKSNVVADIAQHGESLPGRRIAAQWTTGRWPEKQALAFDGNQSRLRIYIPETFNEITLAGWFYINTINKDLTALMNTDGTERNEIHWQIMKDQLSLRWGVSHRGDGSSDYYFKPAALRGQTGRWVYLAATYSLKTKMLYFYRNGRRIHQRALKEHNPFRIGEANIGNWNSLTSKKYQRGLDGRIDEFMIFRRALSAGEIQAMYKAGQVAAD